ncbi:hypothetical protein GCM10019059_34710 [Camelimonas fluminis]|uniref:Uncharacterized protein n=1 Tax=Camelimonas fluminis TaxID=1576911 RepID=A0ABV7UFU3_9HYPH|nr:hypothetical protein [Camelimonas fluminis]GHE72166.1 hypothetical protein GCM10019059_34710 [Camelimonas fluminis]
MTEVFASGFANFVVGVGALTMIAGAIGVTGRIIDWALDARVYRRLIQRLIERIVGRDGGGDGSQG